MAFPTEAARPNCDALARQFAASCKNLVDNLTAWRARINTNSATGGQDAQQNYMLMTSLRTWVAVNYTARSSADKSAIIAAYKLLFSGISTFDPTTDWPPVATAITNFVNWFKTNWPQKTAAGWPAFVVLDVNDELQDSSIPLAGATKTTVLGLIDAIIAAFG